jgi:hypothetical protein
MSRFYGKIGIELPGTLVGGVWTANIEERDYYGDVLSATRSLEPSDKVNDDYRSQDRISIMADAFALEHIAKIKYVSRHGINWAVISVQEERPRLILSLGGVYHGKTAADASGSP